MNEQRVARVIEQMKAMGLPQILVADDSALFYLLGRRIGAMERCGVLLLKADGQRHAFMNTVFQFRGTADLTVHEYRDGEDVYAMIAACLDAGVVGFDKNWPSRHTISILNRRSDLLPVLGSAPVDAARACKDAEESRLLCAAGAVNDQAMAFAVDAIGPEFSEAELASRIDTFFLSHGGAQVGQYQIVSYGPHAAQPHHLPDAAHLRPGDAVLIDQVCPVNGYWCDMTRTVFYRTVSDRHRRIYDIVRAAQQAGIDCVRPGVPMGEIDAAVRRVIADAGYGEAFCTRTGHGIGIDVHEPPEVDGSNTSPAQPGMVFSIEPGIYLEGDVGVRIEDLVLVTAEGCRVLTHYPKELQIVG